MVPTFSQGPSHGDTLCPVTRARRARLRSIVRRETARRNGVGSDFANAFANCGARSHVSRMRQLSRFGHGALDGKVILAKGYGRGRSIP